MTDKSKRRLEALAEEYARRGPPRKRTPAEVHAAIIALLDARNDHPETFLERGIGLDTERGRRFAELAARFKR